MFTLLENKSFWSCILLTKSEEKKTAHSVPVKNTIKLLRCNVFICINIYTSGQHLFTLMS